MFNRSLMIPGKLWPRLQPPQSAVSWSLLLFTSSYNLERINIKGYCSSYFSCLCSLLLSQCLFHFTLWGPLKPMKPTCMLPFWVLLVLHVILIGLFLLHLVPIAIFSALLGLSHIQADIYTAQLCSPPLSPLSCLLSIMSKAYTCIPGFLPAVRRTSVEWTNVGLAQARPQ